MRKKAMHWKKEMKLDGAAYNKKGRTSPSRLQAKLKKYIRKFHILKFFYQDDNRTVRKEYSHLKIYLFINVFLWFVFGNKTSLTFR